MRWQPEHAACVVAGEVRWQPEHAACVVAGEVRWQPEQVRLALRRYKDGTNCAFLTGNKLK